MRRGQRQQRLFAVWLILPTKIALLQLKSGLKKPDLRVLRDLMGQHQGSQKFLTGSLCVVDVMQVAFTCALQHNNVVVHEPEGSWQLPTGKLLLLCASAHSKVYGKESH